MTRPSVGTRAAVVVVSLGVFAAHAALALQQWARFRLGSYDLVIFDQAVRSYSHGHLPVSLIKGVHNGFGPHFSLLGDHFSPVLALLAPLYWVWDDPRVLLLAQAALVALSVPLVWSAAARVLPGRWALAVALAYGIGWPLQSATGVGFHEVAFAVPLTALVLHRATAGRWGQAAIASLGLLLVKEDMGLVVAALGLLALRAGRRRLGIGLVVGGLAAVVVSIRLVIPAFGGRADYYWEYDALGPDPAGLLRHVVLHPLDTLHVLITPAVKWQALLMLAVSVALLCLGSPLLLLAVPLLLERMLSSNPNVWTTGQHYNAFVWPTVVLAAVAVAGRLPRRWAVRWSGAVLVAAVVLCGFFPFLHLVEPHWWRVSARDVAAAAAVAAVPPGVRVEADNHIGPHLSARNPVLLLDATPRGAPWVVLDTQFRAFPFHSVADQQARLALLETRGYRRVLECEGWVVLRSGTS